MKREMNMKTHVFAIAIAALTAMGAFAGEGTLSVSPAVVMLKGTPGQSTQQALTIMNGGTEPFSFEMVAKDVIIRDGKRSFIDAGEMPGSIAATATFSRKTVTVAPGERLTVDVTLTIPVNPASRAVVAIFHGTTKVKSRGMQITASLGTLMTFTLSDELKARTSALKVTLPTATSNFSVAQQMINDGHEPVFAKGMLAIVNGGGALVAREAIPGRRLLPGEKIDIRAEYGGDLAAGHYRALVTYQLQNSQTLTSSAEFDVR
jgi:hypothetical protein